MPEKQQSGTRVFWMRRRFWKSSMIGTKPGKCKQCRNRMAERGQVIHDDCIPAFVAAQKARKAKIAEAVDRALTRQRWRALKTIPDLLKEVRQAFHRWVRVRDKDKPCISCGAPPEAVQRFHHGRDAGHYRSVGSASHLRFHPDNVHAQCVHCNQYLAGNPIGYRLGLVGRIGLEALDSLEHNETERKWKKHELEAMVIDYRTKAKALAAQECVA